MSDRYSEFALWRNGPQVGPPLPSRSPSQKENAEKCFSEHGNGISRFVAADVTKQLPFEDNFFDVVFSSTLVHNLENKQALFSEFARLLKPAGLLLVSVIV